VDFRDTPDEAEYRTALRRWLEEHIPKGWQDAVTPTEHSDITRLWHRTLYEGGYIGQTWPVEWGGRGLSPIFDAILNDETGLAGAPPFPGQINFLGRAISLFADESQKRHFLPGTLDGSIQWCQGFSEPGAGSDLAALQTRAVREGDRWVINGQKMWTTGGLFADWCLVLARTDPTVAKHKGLSMLLVNMRSPGLSVRPIVLANGDPETAEVFLDDVEVSVDAVLGEPGDGWRIAMTTLSFERGPIDIGFLATYQRSLEEVTAMTVDRGLIDETSIRRQLAKAYVRGEVLRLNALQQLSRRVTTAQPGAEGSVTKLLWSQTDQELAHLVLEIIGPDAVTGSDQGWFGRYIRSRPVSVYGGSSQIQCNLIAWRILGMPRSDRRD
jgi:alkylation response protein AidB-like acyl-CoA dehydrogenase